MTKQHYKTQAVRYWLDSADDDWDTAETLFKSGKYHHSLFFAHLTLEKLLKGKIVELTEQQPPAVHNLVLLVKKLESDLDDHQLMELEEISSFNLSARYDSYKLEFYKKATQTYATKWLDICEKWLKWIKKLKK